MAEERRRSSTTTRKAAARTTRARKSAPGAASRRPYPTAAVERGSRVPVFLGVLVLAAAAAVALILILSGNDESTTFPTSSTPTAVALTPGQASSTQAKTRAAGAPARRPAARASRCDPIIGSGTQNGGKSYAVTSSATDGPPARCAEAHSVLLAALNGGGTTIGDWRCTTRPAGPVIASCTSAGGRKILARG